MSQNSNQKLSFKSIVMASRPKTLIAAFAPIFAATALVYLNGFPIVWWVSICALLCVLFLQLATNFFNDAIDFQKGADTNERLGPTRVTASGLMKQKSVLLIGGLLVLLAIGVGLPLVFKGGIWFLLLGCASVLLAYAYTGGPFPLAYLGLGELFVILFFGLVAVCGTYFLNTQFLLADALVLGLQQGFLATVLIVINNARDIHSDRKAGKMTLAARFGERFAKVEVVILYALFMFLNLHWLFSGWTWLFLLVCITGLMAFVVIWQILRESPSRRYNAILARAGLTQLVFTVQFCLGVFIETHA